MQSVSTDAGRASPSPQEVLKGAIVVDTKQVRSHLDEVVRSTVEQTLNQLLDEEADRVAGAGKYERSVERRDTRAGSYRRKLQTKAGEVELTVPRLRTRPWRPPSSSGTSAPVGGHDRGDCVDAGERICDEPGGTADQRPSQIATEPPHHREAAASRRGHGEAPSDSGEAKKQPDLGLIRDSGPRSDGPPRENG